MIPTHLALTLFAAVDASIWLQHFAGRFVTFALGVVGLKISTIQAPYSSISCHTQTLPLSLVKIILIPTEKLLQNVRSVNGVANVNR